MTTQKEIRASFWKAFPQFKRRPGKTQNDYPATIRKCFVDYLDSLQRNGEISEPLACRATL